MDIRIIRKISLIVLAIALLPSTASCEESPWVVVDVKGGAWKSTGHDPAVRTAVQAGDTVLPTDRVETFQYNEVALTKDPAGQNILTVQGAFQIGQSDKGTQIHLERGRALAILDGLKGSDDFSVTTHAGVAAVRGTRFIVETPGSGMQVKTFEGEVRVGAYTASRGSNRSSRTPGRSISVLKGQKTAFEAGVKTELATSDLSRRDWEAYEASFDLVRSARKSLESNRRHWFGATEPDTSSRRVSGSGPDNSGADKSRQTIVF